MAEVNFGSKFVLNEMHNIEASVLLGAMESGSVDSIVTDPPAGISFMGKKWDHHKGGRDQWIAWMQGIAVECLRVLKPGGHALVWALPRTSHWTATAWENAGFEVRDRVSYLFGSGFPKSLDVSKAMDKEAGVVREDLGLSPNWREGKRDNGQSMNPMPNESRITVPATELAKQWDGWGTALKPACEDWWLLRKPIEGTVAQNVQKYRTGAINIDGCRVEVDPEADASQLRTMNRSKKTEANGWGMNQSEGDTPEVVSPKGRWPANIIHDGSEEVLVGFPVTVAAKTSMRGAGGGGDKVQQLNARADSMRGHDDNGGSAARFFYCAKASRSEREEGLEGMSEARKSADYRPNDDGSKGIQSRLHGATAKSGNHHPTVKPLALMEYLVRLITPPKGIVLDPFAGSGTTCGACIKQGFQFIACDDDVEYFAIAQKRIERWRAQTALEFG